MRNFTLKMVSVAALLVLGLSEAVAQTRITGVVSDSNGALIGANVVVKGTAVGTTTNTKGEYALEAGSDQTLVFSYLGYIEQEVKIGNRTRIDIVLQEDSQQLEALVVVGYGMQRRQDVTGAVASVKMADMKYTPGADPVDLLRGRVAGVEITSSSGRPGSVANIKIRGDRSLTGGNAPLYVVDGMPTTAEEFGMINGADIASIEVLKDAASQAIYGTRAANGVVLVTTKRGEKGRVQVTLDSYASRQSLWRNFDFYGGNEFYNLRREALAGDRMYYSPEDYELLQPANVLNDAIMEEMYSKNQFTDWEELMLKPSWAHKHDLSIRGGNDRIKVAAGLGYYDQTGMVRTGSRYQRATARLNVDFNVYKWLSVGFNTSYGKSGQDRESGSFTDFITRAPLAQIYNPDGSYTTYINSAKATNPLYSAQYFDRDIVSDYYRLNTFIDIKPFKGFSYRFNASYFNRFVEDGQYTSSQAIGSSGSGSLSNTKNQNYLIENIINYAVPIRNDKHKLNVTLVQSYDYTVDRAMSYSANNVPVDRDWNMLPNGEVSKITRGFEEEVMLSFMGRIQYSFRDKYLLTAAVRRDGSSKFGVNNKWASFPSVSAGWRISEEPWLKDVKQISNLKLRASWGQVGSHSALSRYKSLGLAGSVGMEFGDEYVTGYLPGTEISNPNIGWETTSQTNVGVDFGMFDNRLTGTVEYYYTTTNDLLVKRTISGTLGYTDITDNRGKTRTFGTDISLNGDIFRNEKVTWSVGTNFSLYRNKILRINGERDENGKLKDDVNNKWFIGSPLNVYYDYDFEGIYQYEDFERIGNNFYLKPTYDTDGDGVADTALQRDDDIYPGAIKVRDVNGDGKIDANDKVQISKDPKFTMSLTSTVKWKGIDLFVDFYGVYGRTIQNKYLYDYNSGGSLQGTLNGLKVNYWTPENASNKYPRPRASVSIPFHSSLSYQDASYLRLRTLTLGYTLPYAITSKAHIERLRLYVTATNLFTATNFLSYSPELTPGAYPEARQWVFGLNLSF